MYTIEFQKRGLSHAHILVWFKADNKMNTSSDIDNFISAKLSDPVLYPKLFKAVTFY